MKRKSAPGFEQRAPECPLCYDELRREDQDYMCDSCEAWWYPDGDFGGWNDPDLPQCQWWYHWGLPFKEYDRCLLEEGHEHDHTCASFHGRSMHWVLKEDE